MDITTYCPKCQKLLTGSLNKDLHCSCSYVLHDQKNLTTCPICQKQDFYRQKDFNPKIGIGLFILASILSIFTYGLSFIALYLIDLWLYKKIPPLIICYHCQSQFRNVLEEKNIDEFDHYKHDMLKYNSQEEL